MDERTCPVTGDRLGPDRYVSGRAVNTLRGLLDDLPGKIDDLMAAMGKQFRFAEALAVCSPGAGSSIPINPTVAEHYAALTRLLTTWAVWVAQVRGHKVPRSWAQVEATLTNSAEWLARHPEGPNVYPSLIDALRRARTLVDRPPDMLYAGVCHAPTGETSCPNHLYAKPDSPKVRCYLCGAEWLVEPRRKAMLAQAARMALPATLAAQVVSALTGKPLSASTVRVWKARGDLAPVSTNPAGHPVYRVADILAHITN